jgi:hypothetical protein
VEYQQIAVGQPNCMYQCRGGIAQMVFPILHDLCKLILNVCVCVVCLFFCLWFGRQKVKKEKTMNELRTIKPRHGPSSVAHHHVK